MQKARVEARERESSEGSLVYPGAGWSPGVEFCKASWAGVTGPSLSPSLAPGKICGRLSDFIP